VVREAVPADELRRPAQAVREAVAGRQTLRQAVERVRDRLPELSAAG
jgi:hypothetical protein